MLPTFNDTDVGVCLACLRKKNKLDSEGCCVDTLTLLFMLNRADFTSWLLHLCASTRRMSELTIRGKFWGKVNSCSELAKLRALFPQQALVALVDALLERTLNGFIDDALPLLLACFWAPGNTRRLWTLRMLLH